ncbi:MAG: RsmD family RNA methyltransferase [Candidatus Omnitrophota bacterium]
MPKGIRPSRDKVRKALFDILGDIEGVSLLELFAGSGAIAIEALSQGVKEVVLVERDPECIKIIKDNFSLLDYTGYTLIPLEVPQALNRLSKAGRKFDLIFMDPPYYAECSNSSRDCFDIPKHFQRSDYIRDQSMAKKTLQILTSYDILTPSGFIVVEHFKKDNLPDTLGDLVLFRQYKYADTVLSFYRKK